jgi:hypothetical protein
LEEQFPLKRKDQGIPSTSLSFAAGVVYHRMISTCFSLVPMLELLGSTLPVILDLISWLELIKMLLLLFLTFFS